jgi:hypothetical protein
MVVQTIAGGRPSAPLGGHGRRRVGDEHPRGQRDGERVRTRPLRIDNAAALLVCIAVTEIAWLCALVYGLFALVF